MMCEPWWSDIDPGQVEGEAPPPYSSSMEQERGLELSRVPEVPVYHNVPTELLPPTYEPGYVPGYAPTCRVMRLVLGLRLLIVRSLRITNRETLGIFSHIPR